MIKNFFCNRKSANIITTGLLVLFTYAMVSCSNKKDAHALHVIPVASTVGNYNLLNLSKYATEIRYIPLETNDSTLISGIRQIFYENGKILLLDQIPLSYTFTCFLFDNNGKFYRKIGQPGQGPDDYNNLRQVFMHENFIYLKDYFKVLIYDTNGNLVEKINLRSNEFPQQYRSFFEILPLKKDTFVMNVASMKGYYPKAILFEKYQSDIKIIKEYPNYVKLDKLHDFYSTDELGIMYRFKDDVRIYKVFNDTIFTIGQNTEMKDAFIFELGKYKPTLSFMEGKETPWNDARKKYIIPMAVCESLNHLFINFNFGNQALEPVESIGNQGGKYSDTRVYGIFDKLTGEFTLMKQPIKGKFGFKNDIDTGPVFWPKNISSDNESVTYISAKEFLDYYDKIEKPTPQMTEIAKRISPDDNPIVIIAKLKK